MVNKQNLHLYLEIKCKEAQIILFLASSIVWHILHHHLHCVYVCVHLSKTDVQKYFKLDFKGTQFDIY